MLGFLTYLVDSARQLKLQMLGCSHGLGVRPLGLLEELMERDNKENIMMMTRVFFLESKQEIKKEYVKLTLDHLVQKYPILRMKICEQRGKAYWCEMQDFKPDIAFDESGNWTAVFEDNSTATFASETGPLWRVIFISNVKSPYTDKQNFKYQYALLFGCHHALFDGRSNLLVFNEFQHVLNTLISGGVLHLPLVVTAENLGRPLDEYVTPQLTFWEKTICFLHSIPIVSSFVRWIQTQQLRKLFQQENLYMKHVGNYLLKPQNKTSVKQIVLTKQESQDLFAVCKKRGVTVQSMLQTASSMALCQILTHPVLCHDTPNIPNLLSVHVNCMLGMKSILKDIPQDSLGYFAVVLPCKLDISEFSDFWDLASQTQQQLHNDQKGLALKNLRDNLLALKSVIKWNKLLTDLSSYGRYPELLMAYSNLGNCTFLNLEDSSQVRINGQATACSEHKVGAIFSHSVVTLLGCLHWNVGYYKNISSEEVVEFYIKEVKRILQAAVEETQKKFQE